jgi:heme/copper-type cytochrome/quinol oxidase subunit 3
MSKEIQTIQPLQEISDIRRIMERSSRFISLSGLSGIAAGICALVGAFIAYGILDKYYHGYNTRAAENSFRNGYSGPEFEQLKLELLLVAAVVLIAALALSFLFTWRRARQNHLPIWDMTARKLMWNVLIPLVTGGLFILALYQHSEWNYIAPACLVFYGLALVNGSKYTLSEIRYLGYAEIILGLLNTQFVGYGLYFWAVGFGVLHIFYGVIMWFRYERR